MNNASSLLDGFRLAGFDLNQILHIITFYNMKLFDSFLSYLKAEKRYSPHTITAYKGDLEQFFAFLDVQYELKNVLHVKHIHVRSWIVHMMENEVKSRSINRKISTLKSFFNFLKRRGKIRKNPMSKVISPKIPSRLPVFIPEKILIHSLKDDFLIEDFSLRRDLLVLELLYQTGMRRSELIELRTQDIDQKKQRIKVLGKGAKERLIPVGNALIGKIEKYMDFRSLEFEDPSEFLLLTNKGKKMYPKFVYLIVHKYLSGISTMEKRSPHVLRHSFATHLASNGAELNAIKELLGHANLSATQIYTHNSIEKLKRIYRNSHPKGN